MSLDGAMLSLLKKEIVTTATDSRIDRIAQPSRDEILLHLRWKGGGGRLLLSASASNPRVQFTDNPPDNPQKPPMFCMLLRKHLSGARLTALRQQGLDRILFFDFEGRNELGDLTTLTLVVEVMGRHSNIILLNQEGKIIDSIRRVNSQMSSVRQVLPGLAYQLPPQQNKLDLTTVPIPEILERLQKEGGFLLTKGLMTTLEGFSPLPARELAFRVTGQDPPVADLSQEELAQLSGQLSALAKLLTSGLGTPTMVLDPTGRPRDFSFLPITQYGGEMVTESFSSYSQLLDLYYTRRDISERTRQRSGDLLRHTENTLARITRRISAQQEELAVSQDRDQLRIYGDLLTANIHQLKKGETQAVVSNYYDPEGASVSIPLDNRKKPAQNAQQYYGQYRKATTAEKKLTLLITQGQQEKQYIDSVLDSLKRAETEADLDTIRQELIDSGYLRKPPAKKEKKPEKQPPHTFLSTDGFPILAGRNNQQNDRLSLKDSHPEDLWLHTQKIPGSHTVIVTGGKPVPDSTLEQAAMIAAYYSKAQGSLNIPVDYTLIKYVRKASGGRPGMVIYDNFKTLFITPNEQLLSKLAT